MTIALVSCQLDDATVFLAPFEKEEEEAIISVPPHLIGNPRPRKRCERGNETGSLCGEAGLKSALSPARASSYRRASVSLFPSRVSTPASGAVSASTCRADNLPCYFGFAITFRDGGSEGRGNVSLPVGFGGEVHHGWMLGS